jgi:hypothetical protein
MRTCITIPADLAQTIEVIWAHHRIEFECWGCRLRVLRVRPTGGHYDGLRAAAIADRVVPGEWQPFQLTEGGELAHHD